MSARMLKVALCRECPFVGQYIDGCTHPSRSRYFVDHRGMRTTHPSTIPDWCPLPKEENEQ